MKLAKLADFKMSNNDRRSSLHSFASCEWISLIYRDVEPENILISYDNQAVYKWADFGLMSKELLSPALFIMAVQPYFKSGKTFRYQPNISDLVGHGAYGRDKWMNIKNDQEVVALKELRHPFIVTLYAVEDDDDFRNYIFELCQANLEEFITKKYNGVMPNEIEGLYQMASGLKFIHEKKMIHRDIKPENVLIYFDGQRACLKIADLGFTKPLKEDGTHFDLASGLKGTEYYMPPELLVLRNLNLDLNRRHVLDEKCTTASDVFAAGCTFFRYCAGGLHPYGYDFNIEGNIMTGNPVNLTDIIAENMRLLGDGKDTGNIKPIREKILDPAEKRLLAFSAIVERLEDESNNSSFLPSTLSAQNLRKGDDKDLKNLLWKIDLIEKMIKFDPEERLPFSEIVKRLADQSSPSFLQAFLSGKESLPHVIVVQSSRPRDLKIIIGDLQFDRRSYGGSGKLFHGTFKNKKVAVKRMQILDSDVENRELKNNKRLSHINHPNILLFIHYEKDNDFGYFIFELCASSLEEYIKRKYQGPMPTEEQVLFQLASGLEFIHSNGILYRNFKPENVLISLTKPVQMKYCGFGCSKSVNERGTCTLSGVKETYNWKSPEELKMMAQQEENEILRGSVKTLPKKHFARPFVIQMIEHEPEKRISLSKVIEYLKPLQPPNRLSLLQYDLQNWLSSTGTFSLVYDVVTIEGSSLAVKRVPIKECATKSFDELKQLDHSNIIRLLHFDQDDDYKFFGMELCAASLDQLFLPIGDPKKYEGSIPTDEQFCFQLISGLQYIHKKGPHSTGPIKPTNILISSSENDPQIKLSDFGLTTTSRLNEGHTTQRSIGGFLSSRYWLAPELLDPMNEPTKESDIFAAGSVFFYFLSKGKHLFGDEIHKIIANTSEGIHANIFCELLPKNGFPYSGLIRWMTSKPPGDRPKMDNINRQLSLIKPLPSENLRQIGAIHYSVDHFVEGGGQGNVFFGKWKDSQVAVKRIVNMDTLTQDKKTLVYRERENYQKLKHRNIVELFAFDEDEYFMVLALEKCLTSVHDYCCIPQLYRGIIPMPSDQEVLLQMAQGLEYIHSQGLIHRDVKPHNILISGDNPAVIRWADFGMTRAVITGSKTFSWSKLQGTDRWLAPELIEASQEKKIRGRIHPFGDGDDYSTKKNIKEQKQINFDRLPVGHFAFDIIKGMIENDREKRSKLPKVIEKLLECTTSTAIDTAEKFLVPRGVSN
uniref:Protein kinase domain-containing protein n=1 Tax=Daphnia galeata TaxID=27404 RepID=A0A8J2WEA0_9CRUS|nr:unnamed protein product [Daphnia galeata]